MTILYNKLTIIVVTYNSMNVLTDFFYFLKKALNGDECKIIVCDNCSTDGTDNYINSHYPEVCLIKLPENMGYGAALNEGIKLSKTPYVALMNPDVIIQSGGFKELVNFLEKHPEVAAVSGPIAHCKTLPKQLNIETLFPDEKIAINNKYANIFSRIIYFTGLRHKFPKAKFLKSWKIVNIQDSIEVKRLEGSFGVFRKDILDKIRGFDPRLFLYFEEDDIAIKLKKVGYKIYVINKPVIAHIHSKGSAFSGSIVTEKILLNSTYLFFRKYYGLTYAWFSFFTIWLTISIIILLKALLRKDYYV